MKSRSMYVWAVVLALVLELCPIRAWADDAAQVPLDEELVAADVAAEAELDATNETEDAPVPDESATDAVVEELAPATPEAAQESADEPELTPAAIYTPVQTKDLAFGVASEDQLTGETNLVEYRITLEHKTLVRVNLSWANATLKVWDLDSANYNDNNRLSSSTGTYQLSKTLEAGTHVFAVASADATVSVMLVDASSYVTAISVPDIYVPAGDTSTITAGLTPKSPTAYKLTYVSDNPSIAKVSATGVVTGVSAGTTNVTVTDEISGVSTQATVQVTTEVLDATKQDREVALQLGKTYSGKLGEHHEVTYRFNLPVSTKVKINLAWGETTSYGSKLLFRGFDEELDGWSTKVSYSAHAYTATETLAAGNHFVKISTEYGTIPFDLQLLDQNIYATSIEVPDVTVSLGSTASYRVVTDPQTVDHVQPTASVADTSIATVKGQVVTGVKVGTTTLTVTDKLGHATTTATVKVVKAPITRVGSATSATIVLHKTKTLAVASKQPNPCVTWKSSNTKVAKVNAKGVVTATGAGSATITATSKAANSISWKVTVAKVKAKQVKVAKIKNQEYTAKAKKPVPAITFNGKKLKKGTDFTVKYAKNKEMGTATATITFRGSYTGKLVKKFKIVAPKVGKPKFTLVERDGLYTYVEYDRGTNATGIHLRIVGGGWPTFDKHIPGPNGWGECGKKSSGLKVKFMIRSYKKVGTKFFYSPWVTKVY